LIYFSKVTTAAEYQRVIESFPYRDGRLEAAPFPKRFPFSSLVPKVYRQIRNYIQACLQFSQDLNLADQEIDDTLRRYTNLLLTRTLSGCLSTLIRKPSLSLLQLIQISINTNYLEESNGWLEEFIAQLTGASRELSHIARLQGRAVFRDVRDDAEQQIYEALKRKMDEFMELANYDWQLNEPSGQASSFLMDLIAFLQSTFQAFTNLKVGKPKRVWLGPDGLLLHPDRSGGYDQMRPRPRAKCLYNRFFFPNAKCGWQ
jgi:hypothetical protein